MMYRNYITIAIRNLFKHKTYYAINTIGLAIGMACLILTTLFVLDEFDYNKRPGRADRIYRVIRETQSGTATIFSEGTSGALAISLQQDFPEIQAVVRALRWDTWICYDDKVSKQVLCIADENILDVFNFPLVQGNLQTLFVDPSSIVITEEMAQKYFGEEESLGKIIQVESTLFGDGSRDYTVVGVLKNIRKSTFDFDFLIAPNSIAPFFPYWENWVRTGYRYIETYILLSEGHPHTNLESKIQSLILKHMGEDVADKNAYHLQPYLEVHLFSKQDYGLTRQSYGASGKTYGDLIYIYGSSTIAAFVLIIACINFINLTTAHSVERVKEIGIRKVIGARRRQLIYQFIGESVFLSFFGFLIALIFVQMSLPTFNLFVERNLTLQSGHDFPVTLGLCLVLVVGVLGGWYPAFLLAALQPDDVLKSRSLTRSQSRSKFQKGLVIFQFSISVILLVSTFIVHAQISYIKNKDLGFDKESVVILPIFHTARELNIWGERGIELKKKYNLVKQEFLKHPRVLKATTSRFEIGGYTAQEIFVADGTGDKEWQMRLKAVDEDFFDFYSIDVTNGRTFLPGYAEMSAGERRRAGIEEEFIVNETAVKYLGWQNPIGKRFGWRNGSQGRIVGVISDFHFRTLHDQMQPLVIVAQQRHMKLLHLKILPNDITSTLSFLKQTWKQFIPTRPFEFSFLDADLDHFYKAEQKLGQIFSIFSGLAMFVACMGLFSLASLVTQQRTKEIGIRKILGASTINIIGLLSLDFTKLIVIANVVAWPLAYYTMNGWLQNFAYRIALEIWPFLGGSLLVVIIALITVGYQSFKAAQAKPMDTLRSE